MDLHPICSATLKSGTPCTYRAKPNCSYCGIHRKTNSVQPETDKCPLCSCKMTKDNSMKTSCGHLYHETCIVDWKNAGRTTCFVCSSFFKPTEDELDSMMEQFATYIRL